MAYQASPLITWTGSTPPQAQTVSAASTPANLVPYPSVLGYLVNPAIQLQYSDRGSSYSG